MGFLETLTLIFLVLKLGGVVDWPWVVVASPLFIIIPMWILIFLFKCDT